MLYNDDYFNVPTYIVHKHNFLIYSIIILMYSVHNTFLESNRSRFFELPFGLF